jgi:hypothetical protein
MLTAARMPCMALLPCMALRLCMALLLCISTCSMEAQVYRRRIAAA